MAKNWPRGGKMSMYEWPIKIKVKTEELHVTSGVTSKSLE